MSFKEIFEKYQWETIKKAIYSKTQNDVKRALNTQKRTLEDFMALLSPAATPFLEQMARESMKLTQKRFGRTILLYAPMYLSNECQNICTYCGFSFNNKIRRKTLTNNEIITEIQEIKKQGFNHILLVTGEANHTVHTDYFLKAIDIIKPYFSNISLEVQPLSTEDYAKLKKAGLHAVLVYQETYNQQAYKNYHPKGKKSNFFYRLDTPDRIGKANLHKIGLGVLLGLEDWRTDSFFCALHLHHLQKTYWKTKFSISFPRIRPAEGIGSIEHIIQDRDLVQLICAYRLFNEDIEISISTRESEKFRNNIIPLGVTTMSAGSKTNPGGYAVEPQALEQFEISDNRTVEAVAQMITNHQYDPIWKDWDPSLQS